MKKPGLIGGVGPESTVLYYRGIVYGVQKRVGTRFFPNLAVESLSSFELVRLASGGQLAELADYLMAGIDNLAACGADFAAMACNTGHIVFAELARRSPIPLLSIVDATCAEARKRRLTRIGLLGTRVTMDGAFFREPFADARIDIVTPGEDEKDYLEHKIGSELELGIVDAETAGEVMGIVRRMARDDSIQAVVLGCTELPLWFENAETPVPRLDTVELHIQAIIEEMLAGN